MRWLALLAMTAGPAWAADTAPDPAVYTCHVYVTGSDERNRPAAMEQCVRDVLVKLSGHASAADSPDVGRVRPPVEDYFYIDLMSDIPTHDEQGTRDRPYELIGHVDPDAAAALVKTLGLPPWTARRAVLPVNVVVRRGAREMILSSESVPLERQREALLAAADRFGIRVTLPLSQAPESTVAARFPPDRETRLVGTLEWSDMDFGWVAAWTFYAADAADEQWVERGVSFDQAFRSGIGGAAERLSKRQAAIDHVAAPLP